MLHIKSFTFNPYQENTYLIFDDEKNCVVVDPGMHNYQEEEYFASYIQKNELNVCSLINTHGHIDHVLGNKFICDTYHVLPNFHENELPLIIQVQNYAPQMGIRYEPSPIPDRFLTENDKITIGNNQLSLILAPGHSPGHLCLYSEEHKFLIGGDVLFYRSIGRTDLPGGNHQQLLNSIANKIYTLAGDTLVYPGHGQPTNIQDEKENNPFLRA
ncbi:MBL fold metallo-hydrolase [Sphingobacterium sp. HJSM2_6]|uniref:MBL fold metallo-hydrolase n=1 Tax=Sphingobacterium sp. HJSM2_6 TaxID=3366264 RepID=UPI003BDA793F